MRINDNEVAARIKAIRLSKGLTMEEFGNLIDNAAQSLVSRWETGSTKPTPNRLKIIARLGGMTPEELVFGKQDVLADFTTEQLLDEIKRRLHS